MTDRLLTVVPAAIAIAAMLCGCAASSTPTKAPPLEILAGVDLTRSEPVCLAMQIEDNGIVVSQPVMMTWPGQSASVSVSGAEEIRIDAVVEDYRTLDEAAYRADSTYRRDGRIIFRPTLFVKPGEPSTVQLRRAGAHHRVTVAIGPLHQRAALCGALAQR